MAVIEWEEGSRHVEVEALCRARLGSLDGPAAWSQAE
jgi:hypothetical protein